MMGFSKRIVGMCKDCLVEGTKMGKGSNQGGVKRNKRGKKIREQRKKRSVVCKGAWPAV